ncbi:hypothetical protein BJ742DRAFT_791314 [Cladochytrium replicatum]|nr:hypothetical protein BJ742DRAFT_791314 [Cladochytrium replicatum]
MDISPYEMASILNSLNDRPAYPTGELTAAFTIISAIISIATMIYRQVVFKPKAIARELLITSMLMSGLINSVNTTASGIIFLTTGSIPPKGSAG